jgi:hypothetical protein
MNHYVDFPVYWRASNSLLNGRQDLYSPTFVWGVHDQLMVYRYPPLFLLIFAPLGFLPYAAAGYAWFALKVVALGFTVRAIHSMTGNIANRLLLWTATSLIAAPYLIEEFHYGNVHFFIVFLTVLALYFFESGREAFSAAVLALAISIKVFPVFFLPYFILQRKFRYVALVLLWILLFNLVPGFHFGFRHNIELLETWYGRVLIDSEAHQFHGGINHSLKGVLQRYLSHIPYERRVTDQGYPNINVADLDSGSVQTLLYVITGAVFLVMVFLCFRRHESREDRLLAYGLIACAIVGFAPSTGYNYFVLLILPGAVMLSYWIRMGNERSRALTALLAAAILLSFLPPLLPGSAVQRHVQLHSPYFFSAFALFLCLAIALAQKKEHPAKLNGSQQNLPGEV